MSRFPIHRSKWLQFRSKAVPSRLTLFCFPYAGGAASVFAGWSEPLGPEIDVVPIELPGRASRFAEVPIADIAQLVRAIAGEIHRHAARPFAFFGHSMGALVCFETARWLRQSGGPLPVMLLVSGRRAPQLPDSEPPLHALDDEPFLAELGRLGGTPDELLGNAQLMELMLPILRADFRLCENYVYAPSEPLDCPIAVFGGLDDPKVSADDLGAWQAQTRAPVAVQMLPGNHFFLHTERRRLLELIGAEVLATSRGLSGANSG